MANRPYDESKFIELVLYVARGLRDAPAGGAIKLNKACWYCEVEHLRQFGTTITGAEYQKLEWGPAPRRLLPVRELLVGTGQAELVESKLGSQTEQRLLPLREPDMSSFTDEEIEVIDRVLGRLRPMNGKEVSDLSHSEPAWFLPSIQETIEPELAFVRPAVVTSKIRERARSIAADRGLFRQ